MRFVALVITAALAATPAVAQSWGSSHDDYSVRRSNAVPSNFDWRSQLDRPGDYRCDQFWDANPRQSAGPPGLPSLGRV